MTVFRKTVRSRDGTREVLLESWRCPGGAMLAARRVKPTPADKRQPVLCRRIGCENVDAARLSLFGLKAQGRLDTDEVEAIADVMAIIASALRIEAADAATRNRVGRVGRVSGDRNV